MDNNLPVPGFTDSDFGGASFEIPDVFNEAPDVSRLPEANITYGDGESSGGSSLRAYEESTYTHSMPAPQPQTAHSIHEVFEKETRSDIPTYHSEQHGWQEPTWGDASAKTAARMSEAQSNVYGGMSGVLAVFNTRPGEEPEEAPQVGSTSSEDELAEAITSYIETFYSEQLKKFKPGFAAKLGKAVSEKVKTKIIPDFFQKKTGDGTPKKLEKPQAPDNPGKFNFKKFVTTDF